MLEAGNAAQAQRMVRTLSKKLQKPSQYLLLSLDSISMLHSSGRVYAYTRILFVDGEICQIDFQSNRKIFTDEKNSGDNMVKLKSQLVFVTHRNWTPLRV